MTIREELWEVALDQYGYVTSFDAARLGLPKIELTKMAHRGRLLRIFQGVYRFPEFRVSGRDQLMEAVLWARDPLAVLSHETALEVRELSDVNPNVIHVTIPKRENPIRRTEMPAEFVIHYENLTPQQRDWWEEIPCVTVETAIDQSIRNLPRPDLINQAIDQAEKQGLISHDVAARQRRDVRERYS